MFSIFIDSNVWFSAFYGRRICSKLIEKSISLGWKVCVSELVLEEVIRNIQQKIPHALSFFTRYLKENKIIVLKNPSITALLHYQGLAEKHDLPIFVPAITHKCNYFITGNLQDFDLKKMGEQSPIRLLTPREYEVIVDNAM